MSEMKQDVAVTQDGSEPLSDVDQPSQEDIAYPTIEDLELLQLEEARVDTEEQRTVDNILLELRALREHMGVTVPQSPANSSGTDANTNVTINTPDKFQTDNDTSAVVVTKLSTSAPEEDTTIRIGDARITSHPTSQPCETAQGSQTKAANANTPRQEQSSKSAFSTGKNFLPALLPEDYNRLLSGLASANSVSMRAELLYTTLKDVALYSHQLADIFQLLKMPAEKISVAHLVRDSIADPHRCCACVLPVLGGETINTCNRVLVALNLA